MSKFSVTVTHLAALVMLSLPVSGWACSSCGCTLSSDWENQGLSSTPGLRMDLRYDYINQNQLRHGSGTASSADVASALANGTVGETEIKTRNHYYTLGLDYSPDRDWGINLQIPYIDRDHATLGAGDTDNTNSHTRSLGDIKLIGRYQGFFEARDTGVMLGVKLATGQHDANFASGPGAGQPLDRSLQPGSGSTDIIVGAYHTRALGKNWDGFAQVIFQAAVQTKDDYRPGNSINLNLGVRYLDWGSVVPQVQVNARTVRRDSGLNADPDNTGGSLVYLSPGVTLAVSKSAKVYGFIQLPVYQYVEGLQLAPRWNASVGLNFSL
jgi:hypothetical protein